MSTSIALSTLPDRLTAQAPRSVLFERAFDLAHFIHGRRDVALEVALAAIARLDVAATAQDRRLSYAPKGRLRGGEAGRAVRSRVLVAEAQLLQRLVYAESEPFERWDEQRGAVDEQDLTVRFVKHLVRITLKRNSFYVVLGVARLLHRYTTRETLDLYALALQDPARVPDDDYCRSRKKQLVGELLERFGGLLTVVPGPRGEQRFQTLEEPDGTRALVEECLRRFAPWDTACPVPERFDPWTAELRDLSFRGDDPDDEHPVEVRRIHAVLEPRCFHRLTAGLGLEAPDRALALPLLAPPGRRKGGGPRRPRGGGRPLAPDEWALAEARLSRGRTPKPVRGRFLSVHVDGVEAARIDPAGGDPVSLVAAAGAEVVDVRGPGGELLATCLRSSLGDGGVQRAAAVLPDRSELAFELRASADGGGVAIRLWHHADRRLNGAVQAMGRWLVQALWAPSRVPSTLWAALGVCVALLALRGPVERAGTPEPPAEPRPAPEVEAPGPARPVAGPPRVPGRVGVREEAARDLPTVAPVRRLSEVRVLVLATRGEGSLATRFREALDSRLRSAGRFSVTDDPSAADAALKGSVLSTAPGAGEARVRLSLSLVNAEGHVLWTARREVPARTPEALEDLAAAIVQEWSR